MRSDLAAEKAFASLVRISLGRPAGRWFLGARNQQSCSRLDVPLLHPPSPQSGAAGDVMLVPFGNLEVPCFTLVLPQFSESLISL